MLLYKQGRRNKHSNLLAILNCLKRSANSDFCLAVSNIARQQAIHGDRLLHISFHFINRHQLIGGFHIRECILKFALPRSIGAERMSFGCLASSVEANKLLGNLVDRFLRLRFPLRPVSSTHLRQRRLIRTRVLGNLSKGIGRNKQLISTLAPLRRRVLQNQIVTGDRCGAMSHGARDHLNESADTVLLVDDVVTRVQ
ncbi:Uncharacterised protein [Chlamydia trachomatis]|nr:Uncharacterised protein [Chlamydia trachomatis]